MTDSGLGLSACLPFSDVLRWSGAGWAVTIGIEQWRGAQQEVQGKHKKVFKIEFKAAKKG